MKSVYENLPAALVAFSSTFFGVFLAQYLSSQASYEAQVEIAERVARVYSDNCVQEVEYLNTLLIVNDPVALPDTSQFGLIQHMQTLFVGSDAQRTNIESSRISLEIRRIKREYDDLAKGVAPSHTMPEAPYVVPTREQLEKDPNPMIRLPFLPGGKMLWLDYKRAHEEQVSKRKSDMKKLRELFSDYRIKSTELCESI